MRNLGLVVALCLGVGLLAGQRAGAHQVKFVKLLDDCDPTDEAWERVGGCTLTRGDVTREAFDAELTSPLADAVIGHHAWRNEPAYLKIDPDGTIRVKNKGGQVHTFTEVAAFGGGRMSDLNVSLDPAPECATATDLAPGDHIRITDLSVGDHRFMCCIHPWMRTLVTVRPEKREEGAEWEEWEEQDQEQQAY